MFLALHHAAILKAQLKAATIWEAVAQLDRIKIPIISQLKNTTEGSGVISRTRFPSSLESCRRERIALREAGSTAQ